MAQILRQHAGSHAVALRTHGNGLKNYLQQRRKDSQPYGQSAERTGNWWSGYRHWSLTRHRSGVYEEWASLLGSLQALARTPANAGAAEQHELAELPPHEGESQEGAGTDLPRATESGPQQLATSSSSTGGTPSGTLMGLAGQEHGQASQQRARRALQLVLGDLRRQLETTQEAHTRGFGTCAWAWGFQWAYGPGQKRLHASPAPPERMPHVRKPAGILERGTAESAETAEAGCGLSYYGRLGWSPQASVPAHPGTAPRHAWH